MYRIVRPTSSLSLKVYDHSVLRTTHKLIGEGKFNLIDILRQHNGKISNISLHLDLKHGSGKVGTLVIKMDGLRIDMSQPALKLPPTSSNNTTTTTTSSSSSSASTALVPLPKNTNSNPNPHPTINEQPPQLPAVIVNVSPQQH